MPRSTPPLRRRQRSAAVLAATLVALGMLTATSAQAGEPVSAHLGDPATYSGIISAWPGDKDKDPSNATREIDGHSCWSTSDDPFNRYIYVDVDSAVIPQGATRALVTVTFFDAASTGMRIAYDAMSTAWKTTSTQPLLGTGAFVSSQFELTDIRFKNNANGADFRIDITANEGSVPPICVSDIVVDFTDSPPLTITSPSLLFPQGDADITLSSSADSVDYVIGNSENVPLSSGTVPVAQGAGSIDVSTLGPGYYTLTVTADSGAPVTRTTSFGIVTATPNGALSPDSFYGLGMHYGWQDVATEDALLESMALVGWGSTRSDAYWSSIEKTAGVYSFDGYVGTRGSTKAAELGIDTTFNWVLNNPLYDGGKAPSTPQGIAAYAAYATAAAHYYADVAGAFSVWNEYNSTGFNNGACGITAECYLDVLSNTFDTVKASAPETTVAGPTSAGLSLPFAERLIELGGLDKLDVYTTNVYGYHEPNQTPETGTYGTDLPTLVNMVDDADGDRDIPFWITETGTATHTAGVSEDQQAERIVRAQVLAMAAGVDKLFIYDALDDGDDDTERENRFGQFRRPATGIAGISPKPSVLSTAVLIREFPEASIGDREDIGDADVYSYASTANETSRVLWSLSPKTVAVHTSAPVTLTDIYGGETTLTPNDGIVWLDLSGSPVYLHGDVADIAVAEAPVALHVDVTSVTNGLLSAVVSGMNAPASTVRIGDVSSALEAGNASTELSLPPITNTGVRTVTAYVSDADGIYAVLRGDSTVIDAAQIAGRPNSTANADGIQTSLQISIINNNVDAVLALDQLSWSTAGVRGTVEDAPASIAPGSTTTVEVPITDVDLNTNYPYTVTASTANGEVRDSGTLSWSPIPTEGLQAPAISLDRQGNWIGLRGGTTDGPADLGGEVRIQASDDGLHVAATITDDIHIGDRTAAVDSWQVDSLQFSAYTAFPGTVGAVRTEFTAALLDSGPVLYAHQPAPGQAAGPAPGTVEIIRDNEIGTTTYSATVPWTALGFEAQPAEVLGLSLLVNDADTSAVSDVRSGFIEWGSGVGTAPKDPSKFMSAQVVSAASQEPTCDTTIDTDTKGAITASFGTTCIAGATVYGPVVVGEGAALHITDATIKGMLVATSASDISLSGTDVRGIVAISNTTGPVRIDASTFRGAVSLRGGSGETTLTGNEMRGLLSCLDNDPQPVGSENTIRGVSLGQCEGM